MQKRCFVLALTISSGLFGHLSLQAQRPDVVRFSESYDIDAGQLLHVDLDVDAAVVLLKPSSASKKIQVTAYHTKGAFDFKANYSRKRSELTITFEKERWIADSDNLDSELVLALPEHIEMEVRSRIKAGQVDMDLGNMAIRRFELTTWAGEVDIDFSEPNKAKMDYLEINTKIGQTKVHRLGNARFQEAEINGGIGEMRLDFRGNNLQDANAEIDLDIGETTLHLPDDVGIKLQISKSFLSDVNISGGLEKSGKYYYSRNYDDASSTLKLRVASGLGELVIK